MSMVDFLFAPPAQKVLRLVYGHPEHSFLLNELLEGAGSGRGNSQRHVEVLLRSGVLKEVERRGRQRMIRANVEFPLYPELYSIYRKSFGLLEPIREALEPFKGNIEEAFVFGSVASGTDSHRSDVDLMVVGNLAIMDVLEKLGGVESIIGRPVNLNLYTPEEWHKLRLTDPVVSRIATNSIIRIFPDVKAAGI